MSFNKKAYMTQWRAANSARVAEYSAKYRAEHKELYRTLGKSWRVRNLEYAKKKHRQWRLENPEALKNIKARNYLRNKEKIKDRTRSYYQAHKEKASEYHRNYSKINAAKISSRQRKWYSQNPQIAIACAARRRVKKAGATIGNAEVIAAWEKRWRAKKSSVCYWCRKPTPSSCCHTDHIVALHIGGAHSIENLCIACQLCNHRKHAKTITAWNREIQQPVLAI